MQRNKTLSVILIFGIIAVLACTVLLCREESTAYADEVSRVLTVTYESANGEVVAYDLLSQIYARKIKITYKLLCDYYTIHVRNYLSAETVSTTPIYEVPASNEVVFSVPGSGYLQVLCYACDADGNIDADSVLTVVVRSDNTVPNEAVVSEMTEWSNGTEPFYFVLKDATDTHSQVSSVVLTQIFDDASKPDESITLGQETGFTAAISIYEACEIFVDVFDKAGNVFSKRYDYKLFDKTAPTAPTIVCTPNVAVSAATGGYAKDYTVAISCGEDAKSGVNAASLRYTVNGVTASYDGGFVLKEGILYTITAYYSDIAGNPSETTTVVIDNIDNKEPTINSMRFNVDLTETIPYTVSVSCGDAASGVASVKLDGVTASVTKGLYNYYTATFSSIDVGSIKITVTDKVGNFTVSNLPTYHFDDVYLEEKVVLYRNKYLELNRAEYTDIALEEIKNLYTTLSILLMAERSTEYDFNTCFAQIDVALAGELKSVYKIASAPSGISSNITYEINADDLTGHKKGDVFLFSLSEAPTEHIDEYKTRAVSIADFGESNAFPFSVALFHNDAAIDYRLENGINVSMAVPYGYEARYFKIVDLGSGTLIECLTINNTLNFTIHTAGDYAVVIEGPLVGEKAEDTPKGVKVFGKTISFGAFFGSLAGVIAVLVGAIVVFSLIYKRRNGASYIERSVPTNDEPKGDE